MDDAIALEDYRETVVVPARDRRLRLRASADRGMAGGRRAELLLDLVHGEAAFRPLELRLAYLYLVVHDESFGDRGARQRTAAQHGGQNAGLHATTLPRDSW